MSNSSSMGSHAGFPETKTCMENHANAKHRMLGEHTAGGNFLEETA
eukprot:CAMPEP_0114654130 /NCGR_PEP_ID=MMETSP0191-20121206/10266_1 /TAXON_ID=126664 /ORGANISM="Sorites sp." /LENGTH=45 /DNA_ID= /DNA_START= /DNA_END= /DNA_ORIENTATION=